MFRLFLFIRRYNFPIFFLLLEFIAFSFIFTEGIYQRIKLLNAFQEVSGSVYKSYSNTRQYFHLRELNDSLAAENARMKQKIFSVSTDHNKDSIINDTSTNVVFYFKQGKVVNNSIQARNNYITLNIGRKDGVFPKMGVVSLSGVIGIVKNVSENYALVISILNSDFMVNAKIAETGHIGSVSWDGRSYDKLVLKDIPSHVKLVRGQHVVVGPYSSLFPENTPIGTIHDFKVASSGAFYDIVVLLSSDIRNLYYAYVVDASDLQEQLKLEEEAEK